MSSSVIHVIGPPLSFLNKPALPLHDALCVVFVLARRLNSYHLMWGKGHMTNGYGLGKTEGFTGGGVDTYSLGLLANHPAELG